MTKAFDEARDNYASRATFKSKHTMQAYLRAINLFFDFLGDKKFEPRLPVQNISVAKSSEIQVNQLTSDDEPILWHFALWLRSRDYAQSTIELRIAGIQHWFSYLQEQNWFSEDFSLENAIETCKKELPQKTESDTNPKSVTIKHDLTPLICYYDHLQPPKRYKSSEERLRRWELTRLRNRALLHTLAEAGGQVSGILSFTAEAFLEKKSVLDLEVEGKGGHNYKLHLADSLPMLCEYVKKREIPPEKAEKTPVFVSHDARYDGKRMSRIIAWRVVQRAAKAVGLPNFSPHDLRHWRAQKMIEEGLSLEEVQVRLGHRSIHTVRSYYGHMVTDEEE